MATNLELFKTFTKEQLKLWVDGIPEGEVLDADGRALTLKYGSGFPIENVRDSKGNVLVCMSASGYWNKRTFDANNECIAYENSGAVYWVKGNYVTKEEYEEFLNPKPILELTMEDLESKFGCKVKIKA